MNISCFRCGKKIKMPNAKNADYIIAEDTKTDELREVLFALKHTPGTLAKLEKKEEIKDSEYQKVEVSSVDDTKDAVKITSEVKLKNIQKTGLVCPDCYRETDFMIWGIHK